MSLRGIGAVFFGSRQLSRVTYSIEFQSGTGRQLSGSIQTVDGEPGIPLNAVPDPVNDRMTLHLECGCEFDFYDAGRTMPDRMSVRGVIRVVGDASSHGHEA